MDKRQEKTLAAIYQAFTELINEKEYEEITIQDIVDKSGVGRSTFYCHFKTKNEMLLNISKTIFEHVFSHSLQEEKSHDFSHENIFDYKHYITHLFYHILDEKDLIKGVMSSSGITIFLNEFRKNLMVLANSYYSNYRYEKENLMPLELKKKILIESFISILSYWVETDFRDSPERLTMFFVECF